MFTLINKEVKVNSGPNHPNYGKHLSKKHKANISASVQQTRAHKKRRKLYMKKYYQEHSEKIKLRSKRQHKENRESRIAYCHQRRQDRVDAFFMKFGYPLDLLDDWARINME